MKTFNFKQLFCFIIIVFWLFISNLSYAQTPPDSFEVKISPSSFQVNQSVDITVTAMKNGQVNTTYTGMIWLDVEWLLPSQRTLPTYGWYQFIPSDLWVKTFSKGFSATKEWAFKLTVENYEQTISWFVDFSVIGANQTGTLKKINILSPAPYAKELQTPVPLLASAPDLPNAFAQIYLNSLRDKEILVGSDWTISYTLTDVKAWENTVYISITDLDWKEVWKSDTITFIYEPSTWNLFKNIVLTPLSGLRLWDKITFDVTTDPSVNDVSLVLSNWQPSAPMEKITSKEWAFTKALMLISTGTISVDLILKTSSATITQTWVASFIVSDETLISNVVFKTDPKDLYRLYMSWAVSWEPTSGFQILYWAEQTKLDKSITIAKNEVLFQWLDSTKQWFFQIIPIFPSTNQVQEHSPTGVYTGIQSADLASQPHGSPSDIYKFPGFEVAGTGDLIPADYSWDVARDVVSSGHEATLPTCLIQWIRIQTQKIGDKYYLVRDPAQNVKYYTIYSSTTPDPNTKTRLLDTIDTRYEYPFDYSSKEDVYAYFRVEATCADWQVIELEWAKKVHVWPLEDFLLLVFVSLLIYWGIKLYRYSE